ncbi:MAG: hypothetical protein K2H15_04290, partial [Muribaculaceae bacterium]|nr:hypothetical protein [Muribaculaceae bacterium]
MLDIVKHECGVAMVRLLKATQHYEERYGDSYYGLHLLEKLLIRQYNRGQDGAGIGCIDISGEEEKVYVIKSEGPSAVEKIAESIDKDIMNEKEWGSDKLPYYGQLMLGHVRYSTTGRSGIEFLHPFRYDFKERKESFLMCGNFHLINTPQISSRLSRLGIDISPDADTKVLLNHIATAHFTETGERRSIGDTLKMTAPDWDGGFVICGIDTFGEWWAVRDSHGIRPAFWYSDDEKVILASEKSAIRNCAGVDPALIRELHPGVMIKVDRAGKLSFKRIIEEKPIRECVFERIYFSRADNSEITLEREKLGYYLAKRMDEEHLIDLGHTFFSFVPASARSSFLGMIAYFADRKLPVT